MASSRNQIIEYIEQGLIDDDKIGDALSVAAVIPSGPAWRQFIDRLLLWLGALAIAAGVVFFIAFNWADIGRFAKFVGVQILIVAAIAIYLSFDQRSLNGKVSLTVATILVGVLLALYGQTYQTGADPWQLFFTWALLILPWAVISRLPVVWLLWIGLINLSLVLYFQHMQGIFWIAFGSRIHLWWWLFALNGLALASWELLSKWYPWMSTRWAPRILAVAAGIPMTWLMLLSIFDYPSVPRTAGLAWIFWLGGLYVVYRIYKPDLFMLAGACLSAIVVIVSFASRTLLGEFLAGSFLLIALLVVGLGSGAAIWLKNVHQECES